MSVALRIASVNAGGLDVRVDASGLGLGRIELEGAVTLPNSPFTLAMVMCRTVKCAALCLASMV
jgi:hypothetical protein